MTVLTGSHVELGRQVERVDSIITDPPYSGRVARGTAVRRRSDGVRGVSTRGLEYNHWTPEDVDEFVHTWSPRCERWFVVLCSHDQLALYERALRAVGRYVFAPVPCIIRGMTVRLAGDGPSSWAVYAIAARPRGMRPLSGTLPGAYVGPRERLLVGGGKPLWLMRALVRDYSSVGAVVCDPCAGAGTTLAAALLEGRAALGAEISETRAGIARQRLERVCQVSA